MPKHLTILAASLLLVASAFASESRVTILHFSDYHAHAVPFYAEGKANRGGVARAIRYLRDAKRDRNTLVFDGGDMMNAGSPAWSDKYQCADWPWLNGIVDAMAYGNHDADYGAAEFARCASSIKFPILGGNVVDENGRDVFRPYEVFEKSGVKIGAFAVMGSDFTTLVKPDRRPAAGVLFTDRVAAARQIVDQLRNREKVNAVVLIGHGHREEDEALARAVPGIDLILGTHSHIKQDLVRIDGTNTWFISPWQYLTYISRVELAFKDGVLTDVRGHLVPVDGSMRDDRRIARRVEKMQRALEHDPKFRDLFVKIGTAETELSLDDQLQSQTALGSFIMNVVREAAKADLAISTTSSFRQSIAPGPITFEDLRATLPYPNQILVYGMSGREVIDLLQRSFDERGTDSFGQISGMSVRVENGRVTLVEKDSAALDPERIYRVATTDYLAKVNPAYREIFASKSPITTGLEVRDEVRKYIETHSPK